MGEPLLVPPQVNAVLSPAPPLLPYRENDAIPSVCLPHGERTVVIPSQMNFESLPSDMRPIGEIIPVLFKKVNTRVFGSISKINDTFRVEYTCKCTTVGMLQFYIHEGEKKFKSMDLICEPYDRQAGGLRLILIYDNEEDIPDELVCCVTYNIQKTIN